jgi:FkbM family methyltransferase
MFHPILQNSSDEKIVTRKYFLDCGGNDGCSIRRFKQLFDDADEYVIHSFEPNPLFRNCYSELQNVIFHEEAVWIEDGEMRLYLGSGERSQGSSLIESKMTGGLRKERFLTVKTIDFSAWIKSTFKLGDFIILKLDIEGAEYELLHKMIADNTMSYIRRLFIEFHYEKIGMAEKTHLEVLEALARLGLEVEPWNALPY